MNTKSILAIAAFADRAHADEADASQYVLKFEGNRTRAGIMAEAATVASTRSVEQRLARCGAAEVQYLDAKARAQAAEAVRLGRISSGEIGNI